jgi:hypothetical protein
VKGRALSLNSSTAKKKKKKRKEGRKEGRNKRKTQVLAGHGGASL